MNRSWYLVGGRRSGLDFVATVPVNKVMIDRGRGHAVVPETHHAHH